MTMITLTKKKYNCCLYAHVVIKSLFILLGLFSLHSVHAATVLGIVTPRNAPELLAGAEDFLKAQPLQTLKLRTTDQWLELAPAERKQLLAEADIVFAAGVFGSAAEQLLAAHQHALLANAFIAVHSDRRLVSASHIHGRPLLVSADIDVLMADPPADESLDLSQWVEQQLVQHAQYREWLLARLFWNDRSAGNMQGLIRYLFNIAGENLDVPTPRANASLRYWHQGQTKTAQQMQQLLARKASWVAVLDYESGEQAGNRDVLVQLCDAVQQRGVGCFALLAKWGEASTQAMEFLADHKASIQALVSLQNFVVGAGEGHQAVNALLEKLDVPVLKGIRISDSTELEWRLSEQGLPWNSVHYRVAMPELQGVVEPLVVAAMSAPRIDNATGLRVALSTPIAGQVSLLEKRIARWLKLQSKPRSEKKIAIIYYNHPPGRHNIGADNLNVPATLFHVLHRLKAAGFTTGPLPKTEEALLDLLQARGVNLPEDKRALAAMAKQVTTVSAHQYQQWFAALPNTLQREMVAGPLAYLHESLQQALNMSDKTLGLQLLTRVTEDLRHAMEGADHPAKQRVMALLQQLEQAYHQALMSDSFDKALLDSLVTAIADTGVEGVRGWGEAPGNVMVHDDQLLIPGLQFGNVFIGPQPPRGWELNEELLHANLSFPPPHQYIAFYQWLRLGFKADAVVHLGRHSTYEFLPRHRVGMSQEDYPLALLDDLPSVYPYIVDGVGEGIQAKRRGLAVMVDHLTPPLESTALYDRLLALRQLIESYESAPPTADAMRQRSVAAIKALVDELKLRDELIASMSGELAVRGITDFEQIDDELLVHEVGHYLTQLQEDFMPLGLHVFGRDWSTEAVDTLLNSMAQGEAIKPATRLALSGSPKAELDALLAGLDGRYVLPGKGNDPIRTPEALPTGRNFYALDGSLIPSRMGYQVGVELADKARAQTQSEQADAVVLWASDVVRDEGAMIAFGFDLLGVKPIWSSRGIVKGLERLDLSAINRDQQAKGVTRLRTRRDTVFTTSGLFRDLYGAHLVWLEQAVLMALDASSKTIMRDYPALSYALSSALEPLGEQQNPGDESLSMNLLAARWVDDARAALAQGVPAKQAGINASYRVFGDAPGTYGAGVNRMVERSGSWQQRSEVAGVYMRRMGHAYGLHAQGNSSVPIFQQRLATVNKTYLGRASNLYGLIDNNDSFDFLGGLSLAVETVSGSAPNNFILQHADADADRVAVKPLETALLSEFRGRFLNPQWLQPLMAEGYAGARTMGSEFLEYLWGWQVTNPAIVKSWVWDEVNAVYMGDSLGLGLDTFLEQGHNAHVKANMLAIMLVAAQKDFWQADQQVLEQVAEQFADLLLANGLPGSGHTSPNHPLFDWLVDYLPSETYQQLQQLLDAARIDVSPTQAASVIAEVAVATEPENSSSANKTDAKESAPSQNLADYWPWLLGLFVIFSLGAVRGVLAPGIRRKEV